MAASRWPGFKRGAHSPLVTRDSHRGSAENDSRVQHHREENSYTTFVAYS